MRSTNGTIMLNPGFRVPTSLPNRRTTPRSYCLTILMENTSNTRTTTMTKTTTQAFKCFPPNRVVIHYSFPGSAYLNYTNGKRPGVLHPARLAIRGNPLLAANVGKWSAELQRTTTVWYIGIV